MIHFEADGLPNHFEKIVEGDAMVETRRTVGDVLQGFANEFLLTVVRWIIARRGVEFLYWADVPAWETYLRENPEYDPSKDNDDAGA